VLATASVTVLVTVVEAGVIERQEHAEERNGAERRDSAQGTRTEATSRARLFAMGVGVSSEEVVDVTRVVVMVLFDRVSWDHLAPELMSFHARDVRQGRRSSSLNLGPSCDGRCCAGGPGR
jgi:hypothetical protein